MKKKSDVFESVFGRIILYLAVLLVLLSVAFSFLNSVQSDPFLFLIAYLASSLVTLVIAMFMEAKYARSSTNLIYQIFSVVATVLAALFMFGAFYSSYMTYKVTAAPELVATVYKCPFSIPADTTTVTEVVISNYGAGSTSYKFDFFGENIDFSEEREGNFSKDFLGTLYRIPGKDSRSLQVFVKIMNRTQENASYIVKWYGASKDALFMKECCFNRKTQFGGFELISC